MVEGIRSALVAGELAGRKILLVEDDEGMCQTFQLWFKRTGADVTCACCSREIDPDEEYDLVVADWGSVRDEDLPMPAPTIYVTGQPRPPFGDDRPHLRPVFYKPFPICDLVAKAQEMLAE